MRKSKYNLGIQKVEHLCSLLDLTEPQLHSLLEGIACHYRPRLKEKNSGGFRKLYRPSRFLKKVQKRINKLILQNIALPPTLHGSIKGRSIDTNACPHVGQTIVVNIDIKSYFPSISHKRVYSLFFCLGCSPDVSRVLTRLTTFKGQLPQGCPTSSSIANLVTSRWMEQRFRNLCDMQGFNLTFYVDDITVSGHPKLEQFVPTFKKILRSCGFNCRPTKIHIKRKSEQQTVTGLVVNKKLMPPKKWRDNLRAQIHTFNRSFHGKDCTESRKQLASIHGKIHRLRRYSPSQADRLRRYIVPIDNSPIMN